MLISRNILTKSNPALGALLNTTLASGTIKSSVTLSSLPANNSQSSRPFSTQLKPVSKFSGLKSTRQLSTESNKTERALSKHFSETFHPEKLEVLKDEFAKKRFVELKNFFPQPLSGKLHDSLSDLMEHKAVSRRLHIPTTENTPRYYKNANNVVLKNEMPVVDEIYHSPSLRKLVADIAQEPIHSVPYKPEEYVASQLQHAGDTHGWHWDDYAYALVYIAKNPPVAHGGSLNYIKDTSWDRTKPSISSILASSQYLEKHPDSGSAYLLRSDTCLHRVAPLNIDSKRMVVTFSYADTADLSKTASHETMELMYPETCADEKKGRAS